MDAAKDIHKEMLPIWAHTSAQFGQNADTVFNVHAVGGLT
jgi:hypothetical protein